jgi:hypothetical protein
MVGDRSQREVHPLIAMGTPDPERGDQNDRFWPKADTASAAVDVRCLTKGGPSAVASRLLILSKLQPKLSNYIQTRAWPDPNFARLAASSTRSRAAIARYLKPFRA